MAAGLKPASLSIVGFRATNQDPVWGNSNFKEGSVGTKME